MTYHRVCNKTNTTGGTRGAGTADSSRTLPPPLFTCLRGVHVVHAVKLHVITFLVPCHDVRCNFSMQYLKKKKIK
jgi:hypothetical protein